MAATSPATEWVDRWRASRGSPPDPPTAEAFAMLMQMPESTLADAAHATGDALDMVRWWKSIADDPARDELSGIRLSQAPIYMALRDQGPMTDDELVSYLGIKKASVSPRRSELQRLGLVREVLRKQTSAGRQAAVWGIVPSDEIELARAEASKRGRRRKHLDDYTLEEQVQIVHYLVQKDEVNAALMASNERSRVKARARREAREANAERDRAWRRYNDRLRQAEREASPELVFLKAVGKLRRAVDAVREMHTVISENIDSYMLLGAADIRPEHWPEVADELDAIIRAAAEAQALLEDLTEGVEDADIGELVALQGGQGNIIDLEPIDDVGQGEPGATGASP